MFSCYSPTATSISWFWSEIFFSLSRLILLKWIFSLLLWLLFDLNLQQPRKRSLSVNVMICCWKKMSVESSFLCSFASRCQLIKITFIEKSSRTAYIHILNFFLTPFSISNFIPSSSTSTFSCPSIISRKKSIRYVLLHTHAGVQARLSRGRDWKRISNFL